MNKFDYAKMQKEFYEKEAYGMNISGNHRFHDSNENYKKILLKPIYDNPNIFSNEYGLDFGCGQGRNVSNLILWFPNLFKKVDGVDISQSNIDFCWVNLSNEVGDNSKYNFYVNDGVNLDTIQSDFYKFVMSTITFQHICVYETRFSLMKEIYRVLKVGGVFSFQMGYSDELKNNNNEDDMMKTNINLLDLDNDILNIIGDYVKHDNNRRIRKEHNFNETDFIMNYLKKEKKFMYS
jgi:SAM-dependent methyltransferase